MLMILILMCLPNLRDAVDSSLLELLESHQIQSTTRVSVAYSLSTNLIYAMLPSERVLTLKTLTLNLLATWPHLRLLSTRLRKYDACPRYDDQLYLITMHRVPHYHL